MNIESLDLSPEARERVYKILGFSYTAKNSTDLPTYHEVINRIDLGQKFESLCDIFDLDPVVAGKHIKKYILHQILDEASTFTDEERNLLFVYGEEPIGATTFGDILDETYFSDNNVRFENHFENIEKLYPKNNTFSGTLKQELEKMINDDPIWYNNLKIQGSTFKPYLHYSKVKLKMPITTQPSHIKDYGNFFKSLVKHSNNYISLFGNNNKDYNPTNDLLEIEKNTDIFFLLNTSYYLFQLDLSDKDLDDLLKICASFTLIEDIDLKLHITKTFIEERNFLVFRDTTKGYSNLFYLLFVYAPLLKDYIKATLLELAPKKSFRLVGESSQEIYQTDKVQELKKKLFFYSLLKSNYCYEQNSFPIKLYNEGIGNKERQVFEKLYRKVDKVRSYRTLKKITKNKENEILGKNALYKAIKEFQVNLKDSLEDILKLEQSKYSKDLQEKFIEESMTVSIDYFLHLFAVQFISEGTLLNLTEDEEEDKLSKERMEFFEKSAQQIQFKEVSEKLQSIGIMSEHLDE